MRITSVESVSPQPYTVLGWQVDDIEAAVDDLAARGVQFLIVDGLPQDPRGIWTAPGRARIAWFHDPDENVLSLQQDS